MLYGLHLFVLHHHACQILKEDETVEQISFQIPDNDQENEVYVINTVKNNGLFNDEAIDCLDLAIKWVRSKKSVKHFSC